MSRSVFVAIALLSIGAVGAALYTQHAMNMPPCPWCVLQRLIFVAIAVAALIGLALRRIGASLVLLLALSGVAAALWQHFVAANSASCELTLADRIMAATGLDGRLPEVFMATASCAEAKVNLIGWPYEFWSLTLFLVIGALALSAMRR